MEACARSSVSIERKRPSNGSFATSTRTDCKAQPRAIDAIHRAHLQHGLQEVLRDAAAQPQKKRDRIVKEEGTVRLELLKRERQRPRQQGRAASIGRANIVLQGV
eukprot:scaffold120241_cov90-Phaeocystis_antarctica.AAC.1